MSVKTVSVSERLKITEKDLPKRYRVKLLGRRESQGLWGIKNTRKPVDELVKIAKSENLSLPIVELEVTKEGILMTPLRERPIVIDCNANEIQPKITRQKKKEAESEELLTEIDLMRKLKKEKTGERGEIFFGIDAISYGVQDMIFTRVFSIIVITDEPGMNPFYCYVFVCENKAIAKDLTYALAAAFQIFSRTIKEQKPVPKPRREPVCVPRILGIDLRTPEEKIEQRFGRLILNSEA